MTSQQIGPEGERAIGVSVARVFGSVEYKGTVDSFRTARQRKYYHVVYTDGDEEEMSQTELRDAYLLGLSEDIERQWRLMKHGQKGKETEYNTVETEVETSEGEGSEYGNNDFNEEVRHKRKQRQESKKSMMKRKQKLENRRSPGSALYGRTVEGIRDRGLSRKAQLINCWLVSWGNMRVDNKIDSFLSFLLLFQDLKSFPRIILSYQ